jgi:peptidoglycan/LPS O-acetylase OafA/YrhL
MMLIWNRPDEVGAWVAAGIPPPILTLALWLATTAAVTPLAVASYRFVELPAMQLWRVGWAGVGTGLRASEVLAEREP